MFASATPLLEIFKEDFLGFVPVTDLSGPGLASAILHIFFLIFGLYLNKISKGYDGTAAMSGHQRGVQAVIRQQCP